MASQSASSVSEGPVSHHRTIDSIHTSSALSPITVKAPTEVEEYMLCGEPGVQCAQDLGSRFEERACLVEGQPRFLEWQDNSDPSSQYVNRDRCIPPQVGAVKDKMACGQSQRALHINVLELKAGTFAVKIFASSERNMHVRLRMDKDCSILYQQDGRNQILRSGSTSLPTVAMVSPEVDNNFSRVPPRCGQYCVAN